MKIGKRIQNCNWSRSEHTTAMRRSIVVASINEIYGRGGTNSNYCRFKGNLVSLWVIMCNVTTTFVSIPLIDHTNRILFICYSIKLSQTHADASYRSLLGDIRPQETWSLILFSSNSFIQTATLVMNQHCFKTMELFL